MSEYRRISEQGWNEFGKQLLKDKGSDEQIAFLQACKDGKDNFLGYLHNNLLSKEDVIVGDNSVDLVHRFTEREFRSPCNDTERIIWNCFEAIPKVLLASCGFWAQMIIDMLKSEKIASDYLAGDAKQLDEEGCYALDEAIQSGDAGKIDSRVRRVLRSMCNPAPRGKRVVFDDFCLGKAYWRWRWASKISFQLNLSSDEVLTIFDNTSYGVFAAKMHSGRSYISQENVLSGLILLLKETNLKDKKLKSVIDGMSYVSAWKAIEMQLPVLNKKEMQKFL